MRKGVSRLAMAAIGLVSGWTVLIGMVGPCSAVTLSVEASPVILGYGATSEDVKETAVPGSIDIGFAVAADESVDRISFELRLPPGIVPRFCSSPGWLYPEFIEDTDSGPVYALVGGHNWLGGGPIDAGTAWSCGRLDSVRGAASGSFPLSFTSATAVWVDGTSRAVQVPQVALDILPPFPTPTPTPTPSLVDAAVIVHSAYGLPGTEAEIAFELYTAGLSLRSAQAAVDLDPAVERLDRPGVQLDRVGAYDARVPLRSGAIFLRVPIRIPDEPGLYRIQLRDGVGTLVDAPDGQREVRLMTVSGEVGAVAVTPTPTVTPTPGPAPGVCGNARLEADEGCDDGGTIAGDGCAANCSKETLRSLRFASVCGGGSAHGRLCAEDAQCPGGSCLASKVTIQNPDLRFASDIEGEAVIVTGQARAYEAIDADGIELMPAGAIPLLVRAEEWHVKPIPIPPFACACLRLVPRRDSGATDFRRGPAAVGRIDCRDPGAEDTSAFWYADGDAAELDPDCSEGRMLSNTGNCLHLPENPEVETDAGERGTAWLEADLRAYALNDGGTCCRVGIDPGCFDPFLFKGYDGIPCTWDDEGVQLRLQATWTTAHAEVFFERPNGLAGRSVSVGSREPCGTTPCTDPGEICSDMSDLFGCRASSSACECRTSCNGRACAADAVGIPFDCDALKDGAPGLPGGAWALAMPVHTGFGNLVITGILRDAGPELCTGDCNADRTVTVDEIVAIVSVALGSDGIDVCHAADANGDGSLTVEELVLAVTSALGGCGAP